MKNVLQGLSDELAAAVNDAAPGLVRVEGRRRIPASGIVWSEDGVIVTANHVLRRDENIRVGLPDGATVSASVAGRDPATDLAVLRAEASDLNPANWAGPDDPSALPSVAELALSSSKGQVLQVGNLVLALGRPGKTVQATLGIVSALGKEWRTHAGGQIDRYLQTDVVMYPGFSGGPLVGVGGKALGLNSSALVRGVSVTIPASTLHQVVETLLARGRVPRGYLGVTVQPVALPEPLAKELGQDSGVLFTSVEPDSPAARGGLLLGDTLVTLDDEPVRDHEDLLALLASGRAGATVPVGIVRGGKVESLTITVGERE